MHVQNDDETHPAHIIEETAQRHGADGGDEEKRHVLRRARQGASGAESQQPMASDLVLDTGSTTGGGARKTTEAGA